MKVIVDGNYILFKSYSVFTRNEGGDKLLETDPILAQEQLMRKFMTDLCRCLSRVNHELSEVVIVFDGKGYWRKDLFDYYKANRKEKPKQAFYDTLYESVDLLRNYGFIVSIKDGLEGDDQIYLWSRVFKEDLLLIITGDRDINQVLSTNTFIWNGKSKKSIVTTLSKDQISKLRLIDVDSEYLQVDPYYLIFEKVLLGDSGDNISRTLPRGKGEKFVQKIYSEFVFQKDTFEFVLTDTFINLLKRYLSTYVDDISKVDDNLILVCLSELLYPLELLDWFNNQIDQKTKIKGKPLQMKAILQHTKYITE